MISLNLAYSVYIPLLLLLFRSCKEKPTKDLTGITQDMVDKSASLEDIAGLGSEIAAV